MPLTQASFRSWGVSSDGCCLFLHTLRKWESKSQLPPVSPPKTELSETTRLASDPFRRSSEFLPGSTNLCVLLIQNGNLLHVNKCSSYTHVYACYVCLYPYIHAQWSTRALFVTKHQRQFRSCCQIFTGLWQHFDVCLIMCIILKCIFIICYVDS